VTDRYIADLLVDKSADRSVWMRMGKTKDGSVLFDRYGETTRISLDRSIARVLRLCVHLRYIDYVQPM
jgi:hypothetical protein